MPSEFDSVVLRHAAHYAALLERETGVLLRGGGAGVQIAAVQRLQVEQRNFLQAFAAALAIHERHVLLVLGRDLRYILELKGEYGRLKQCYSSLLAEGERQGNETLMMLAHLGSARAALAVADVALAQEHAAAAAVRARAADDRVHLARALLCAGDAFYLGSAREAADDAYSEVLTLSREHGLYKEECHALLKLAAKAQSQEDYPQARELVERSAALAEQHGLLVDRASSQSTLGNIQMTQGQLEPARQSLTAALDLRRQLGDSVGTAISLRGLAGVEYFSGALAAARALLEEALAIDGELGNRSGYSMTLTNLASVVAEQGDLPRAVDLFHESAALAAAIGDRHGEAIALINVATTQFELSHWELARQALRASLAAFRELGNPSGQVICAAWTAALLARRGQLPAAAILAAAVEEQLADLPAIHRQSAERGLAQARQELQAQPLDEEELSHRRATGAALDFAEAAAYAERSLAELAGLHRPRATLRRTS